MWTTRAPTTPSSTPSAWPSAATSARAPRGTGTSFSPYLGAGIGAYFSHASGNGTDKTNTQVGGKIFLGAELNSGPFVEAAYEILPQSTHINGSSYRFDGFDVAVGYRF